jgi:hypothetical protein
VGIGNWVTFTGVDGVQCSAWWPIVCLVHHLVCILDWQAYLVLNGCGGGESLQRIEG